MIINIFHRFIRYRFGQLGFRSHFLDLNSCRLHYIQRLENSSKKNIVLIHGIGTSSSSWIKIVPLLNTSDSISCIDLPRYGLSKIKNGSPFFSLSKLADTLDRFIHQTQYFPVTLIGHSLGGWLAALFAIKYPRSVERLILINNAGIRYNGVEQQAELFDIHSVKDVEKLFDKLWYKYPWYFKIFNSLIYRSLRKYRVGEFVRSISEEDFLNQQFTKISANIDIIWGEEDGLISKESVLIMNKLLPTSKDHFIKQCGHVPQLEKPHELASILNSII